MRPLAFMTASPGLPGLMDRLRRIGLAPLACGPAEDRDKPGVDLDEVAWAEPVGFEGDAHLTQRAILADHVLLHRWRALIRAADGGTTSFDLWRAFRTFSPAPSRVVDQVKFRLATLYKRLWSAPSLG